MMALSRLFRRSLSCEQVLEVLQSYLDGEIDEETARRVVGHLDRCDLCDHESNLYRRIKTSLNGNRADIDPEIMSALTRFGERLARGELS